MASDKVTTPEERLEYLVGLALEAYEKAKDEAYSLSGARVDIDVDRAFEKAIRERMAQAAQAWTLDADYVSVGGMPLTPFPQPSGLNLSGLTLGEYQKILETEIEALKKRFSPPPGRYTGLVDCPKCLGTGVGGMGDFGTNRDICVRCQGSGKVYG